jgi:5-methylcytosine-specific restriction endonuclease McrA
VLSNVDKNTVIELRNRFLGYKKIAKIIGKTRDEIRKFCIKIELNGYMGEKPIQKSKTIKHEKAMICENCKAPLYLSGRGRNKRFCSNSCRRIWWQNNTDKKNKIESAIYNLTCKQCGNTFKSYGNKKQQCCSKICSGLYSRKKKASAICPICNKSFMQKRKNQRFCSSKCSAESFRTYNPKMRGKEHIRDFYYREWRTSVFARDEYKCKSCNEIGNGNLRAHHLEGWTNNLELRYEIKNGVTLCKKCHDRFHKKYGYGENTANQFEKFINEISLEAASVKNLLLI